MNLHTLPVIAIVGRPNVGKSTLFNCLTKTRQAIVYDDPGVTRDRQFGEANLGKTDSIVIDTGGITNDDSEIELKMSQQITLALAQADIILFLVDARAGLHPDDEKIIEQLRMQEKPVLLTVNKVDGLDHDVACGDFWKLGFKEIYPITASHGRGIQSLAEAIQATLPIKEDEQESEDDEGIIRVSIVGRPNVGKSTLINCILGESRVIVFDEAGTTRDSIAIPFERHGKRYTLVDTAGVRRKSRVYESVEKFSVIKTLQSIENSDVVVMLIDARDNLVTQDMSLMSFIIQSGKAMVIAINKWDGLEQSQRQKVKTELERRLGFVAFVKKHFISALHGTGVGDLFASIQQSYEATTQSLSTSKLNTILQEAISKHPPPMNRGRRIKLRFAHSGGTKPPLIIIHGNQTSAVPKTYRRYLLNFYRNALNLLGTPLRLEFKTNKNPYKKEKKYK